MNLRDKYYLILLIFLILQIIWFNHIRLFSDFMPMVFIYPLLILPLSKNETTNLLIAFASGLFLDIVSNTGGVFAATAVLITYLRKVYFIMLKNPTQKINEINMKNITFGQKTIYFALFVLLAHITIYFLDSFNAGLVFSKWKNILVNTLISTVFIIFIDIIFFNPAKR